jgi:phosphoribosyl 1,2-cyclic phosphate phosphodiesterase
LREREHPTHLSLSSALTYVEKINPKKAYFIHMCHDFTHAEWEARLSHTCVSPAWDGLEINLENEKETAS